METVTRTAGIEAPDLAFESACWARGALRVAGVDEVGRGAWAGPVVAAAVVLPARDEIAATLCDVRDSKVVAPAERARLAALILAHALAAEVGIVEPGVVDSHGLLPATAQAMNAALAALPLVPVHVLVDGLRMAGLAHEHTPIVRGDARCLSIAAASIMAKVARDRLMVALDEVYPGYGFAAHKGYGTPAHRAALSRLGPCAIHRRSYAPVAAVGSRELG